MLYVHTMALISLNTLGHKVVYATTSNIAKTKKLERLSWTFLSSPRNVYLLGIQYLLQRNVTADTMSFTSNAV